MILLYCFPLLVVSKFTVYVYCMYWLHQTTCLQLMLKDQQDMHQDKELITQ